jgi:hypothetical protein
MSVLRGPRPFQFFVLRHGDLGYRCHRLNLPSWLVDARGCVLWRPTRRPKSEPLTEGNRLTLLKTEKTFTPEPRRFA